MKIKIKQIDSTLPIPAHARPGDAGVDLHAAERGLLRAGERALVRLGVALELPPGKVAWLVPRSGHARQGVTVTNSPGIIDSGYRGEVMCWLENRGSNLFGWSKGDRICQLVVTDFTPVEFEVSTELADSERGEGGFGSTGTKPSVTFEIEADARELVEAINTAAAAVKKK
jgi:dUTP pyrophosphatase